VKNATVKVTSVTTTEDNHGNGTTKTSETTLEWALIAPRASSERTDPHAPAVITAATLYAPFDTVITADDMIMVSDHSAAMDGEWQIEGRPGAWGLDGWQPGLEVALTRAGVK
jgi:head-tail adaptor